MEKKLELEKLALELEKYSRFGASLEIRKKKGNWEYTWLNQDKKEFSYKISRKISRSLQSDYPNLNQSLTEGKLEISKKKNVELVLKERDSKEIRIEENSLENGLNTLETQIEIEINRQKLESKIKDYAENNVWFEIIGGIRIWSCLFCGQEQGKMSHIEEIWQEKINVEEFLYLTEELRQNKKLTIYYDALTLSFIAEIEENRAIGKSLIDGLQNLEKRLRQKNHIKRERKEKK